MPCSTYNIVATSTTSHKLTTLSYKQRKDKLAIIDFGKRVKEDKAKKPKAKPLYARDRYKDNYIDRH